MRTYVLDASALVAFFDGRSGGPKVERLIRAASEQRCTLWMSAVNWGEVLYARWRAAGEQAARTARAQIAQLPLRIADADATRTWTAASLKARHDVPYADCFAAALAQEHGAILVTADPDFARLGGLVNVLWLAR